MPLNKDDPLDSFRGRSSLSPDEMLEDEARAFQALKEEGADLDLVRDILQADELVNALNDKGPLARLVTFATRRLDECSKIWQSQADPAHPVCLNAHRDARAARLLINWVEMILTDGENAERTMRFNEEAILNEYEN